MKTINVETGKNKDSVIGIMKRQVAKYALKFVLFIAFSLILALVIRLFFCNFYVVPSNSMEPTILAGDFIVAEKLTYGARIFTGLKFDRNNDPKMIRAPKFRNIRKNDVTVFNYPYRYTQDTIRMNLEKIFVKRCAGLPGDSIDFAPFYIPKKGEIIALTPDNFKLYRKQIVYETGAHIRMEDSLIFINDTLATYYTFQGNWYFMTGDNITNSHDSRYIGLIPEEFVIGRATLVLTSKDIVSGKRKWNRFMKRIK